MVKSPAVTPATSGSKPQSGNARGRQRRDRILEAALDVGVRQGIGQLSLQDVADAAGVAKSVVLYYFVDRAGLMSALAARTVQPLLAAHALLAETTGDPREHLNRWLAAMFQIGADERRIWLAYVALLSEGTERAPRATLRACDQQAARAMADLLLRGHQQYCWHAPDAPRAATLVRALVDGMLLESVRNSDLAVATRMYALCRGAVLDLLVRR